LFARFAIPISHTQGRDIDSRAVSVRAWRERTGPLVVRRFDGLAFLAQFLHAQRDDLPDVLDGLFKSAVNSGTGYLFPSFPLSFGFRPSFRGRSRHPE